jgi:hypothetical protein
VTTDPERLRHRAQLYAQAGIQFDGISLEEMRAFAYGQTNLTEQQREELSYRLGLTQRSCCDD